jgi:hypothetical protein
MLLSDSWFISGERVARMHLLIIIALAVWLGIYLSRQSAAQLWILAGRLLKIGAWALLIFVVFVGAVYLCVR